MDSAINLIKQAAEDGVNIAEVYVDTVGPPEKYQAKLSEIFPSYKITVRNLYENDYIATFQSCRLIVISTCYRWRRKLIQFTQ